MAPAGGGCEVEAGGRAEASADAGADADDDVGVGVVELSMPASPSPAGLSGAIPGTGSGVAFGWIKMRNLLWSQVSTWAKKQRAVEDTRAETRKTDQTQPGETRHRHRRYPAHKHEQ